MISKELSQKIDAAFKNHFLGDYDEFSVEDIDQLCSELKSAFYSVQHYHGYNLSSSYYKMLAVTFVELTKDWGEEENGWLKFLGSKILGEGKTFSGKLLTEIYYAFRSLEKTNGLFLFKYGKHYYSSICCHAFSPKNSITSFLDMCWDIYCDDLNQSYSPKDSILKLIADSLRHKLGRAVNNNQDVSIGSHIYSLRVGIKVLAAEKPNLLISLLDITLTTIHSLFNDEQVVANTYFKRLINNWWINKVKQFGVINHRKQRVMEHIAVNYNQIKAKYKVIDGKAKLIIPPFRMHNGIESEPSLKIFVNEQLNKETTIPVRGTGIILTTEALEFDLDEFPLNDAIKIRVEILQETTLIYDSKTTLVRDFILLDADKELDAQSYIPGAYFLYTPVIQKINYPADINRIPNTKYLYGINTIEGDVLHSNNRFVFFQSSENNQDIYFLANEIKSVYYRKNGEKFRIVDTSIYLNVDKKVDLSNVGLRYENQIVKLSSLPYVQYQDRLRFDISSMISPGKASLVTAFSFSGNQIIASLNVIKFDHITIKYDKDIYYGDNLSGEMTFTTERYEFKDNFDVSFDEYAISFEEGEIIYYPPRLRWRFDKGEWHNRSINPIFYTKITDSTSLEIDPPIGLELSAWLSDEEIRKDKIGHKVYSMLSGDEKYVELYTNIGDVVILFTRIYLKPSFIDKPVLVNSRACKLKWVPSAYIGTKPNAFILEICDMTGKMLKDKQLSNESGEIIKVNDISPKSLKLNVGNYILKLRVVSNIFTKEKKTIYSNKIFLGDIRKIKFDHRTLRLEYLWTKRNTREMDFYPLYIKNISFVKEQDGELYYCGTLLQKNKFNKKYPVYFSKRDSNIKYQVRFKVKSMANKMICVRYLSRGKAASTYVEKPLFYDPYRKNITIFDIGDLRQEIECFKFEAIKERRHV